MKPILCTLFHICLMTTVFSQPNEDAAFAAQVNKIMAAAGTNFKSLVKGPPIIKNSDTAFESNIEIAGTESSIKYDSKGKTYQITISVDKDETETKALYKKWEEKLDAALGAPYIKEKADSDNDYAYTDKLNYRPVKKKAYELTLTLEMMYVYEDEFSMLNIWIRKRK
jgi:hypothetical protein